jgi:hypothetical protein
MDDVGAGQLSNRFTSQARPGYYGEFAGWSMGLALRAAEVEREGKECL